MKYSVGTLIKEARLAKNLSQVRLAKKLGITSQYIANFERGSSNPSPKLIKKISKALRISTSVLIESLVNDYRESIIKKVGK